MPPEAGGQIAMPNHPVYKPCRWCGIVMTYSQRREHVSRCPQNPLVTACKYCGAALNLRSSFGDHIHKCPKRPLVPDGWVICSSCQEVTPVERFALDPRVIRGHHNQCKQCHNKKTKIKRMEPGEKLKHRHHNIRRNYGVSREQYEALLSSQEGKCAICKRPPKCSGKKDRYLHVDHDHKTASGGVRGLLCYGCNHGIGKFEDNPAFTRAATEYLLRTAIEE